MHETALSQFRKEIRHFFLISFINHVFAALALTFGVMVIFRQIIPVLLASTTRTGAEFSPVILLAGVVATFAGIIWIQSSTRITGGLAQIRVASIEKGESITDEEITSLIVRLLAHYRENRTTIRTMVIVCIIGGLSFLAMGISYGLEYLSVMGAGADFSDSIYLILPAMLLMPGIAIVSLFSSWYFSKFSRVWDIRLEETERSELLMKKTLGLDRL
jgi:O-antigen/teichoic acid export membrane protein